MGRGNITVLEFVGILAFGIVWGLLVSFVS